VVPEARQPWRTFVAVALAVVLVDQAIKWLAWRHFAPTLINPGGYVLLGDTIRGRLAASGTGLAADLIGSVLIVLGAVVVLRRRRSRAVVAGASLVAGGFASNLADRFGLHHLTAPGSTRGVVDFIPSGGASRCNVADLFIVLGLALLVAGAIRERHRRRGAV
jgi:lipoprotein signal peptidase